MDQLVCRHCRAAYPLDEPRWQCDCGSVLDIEFRPVFDLARIRQRKPTLWRYREAIPIRNDASIVSFDEGFTPLVPEDFDGRRVFIKQDQLLPTGSFKDRGASVLVSHLRELGIREVVEDSSGNAGTAIAAYCARAEIGCRIFVPEDTSPAKMSQIQLYGAGLSRIAGTREDTAAAALKAARHTYYASHVWNPFFFQGTKTFAFEVCEQLGWKSPGAVVLPAGNGTLVIGAHIGFNELLDAGIIDKVPAIIAVQAESCAPLHKAFRENRAQIPVIAKRETIAEGIAVAAPVRGGQVIEAVRRSNGDFIVVSDNEIEQALREMGGRGYFIEPTAAVAIAGLKKYLPESDPEGVIVSLVTGHGLKTTHKIRQILEAG
ncbi:MAG: threonine synthase [Chloroflexi bacterium]|nr:threonine synthase [Chloroflexota bacterium]